MSVVPEVMAQTVTSSDTPNSDSQVYQEASNESSMSAASCNTVDTVGQSQMTMSATDRDGDGGDEDWEEDFRALACGRGGVSLAQKIHDEFLVCKICLEDFRNPKCLDCNHTFCEQCIESHVFSETNYKKYSDYREFTCPLCRKRSQMPFGGVRKLPDNHLVSGLMTLVSRRRPLSHCLSGAPCDVCQGSVSSGLAAAAPARCLDCCKSLCGDCATAHRRTAVTGGHSLYDPELMSAVLQDADALSCLDHRNETVAFYCADCERCVCVLCTFDCVQPGQPHHLHEFVEFNTAANRYEKSLSDRCCRVSSEAERLQRDVDTLTECADNAEALRQQVRATAAALRRQLDEDEAALLRRVDELYGPDCRIAVEARPALRDRLCRLREAGRRADLVLEHRGVELLLMKKVIVDQLETEERMERNQPRTELPDAVWKLFNFVPGSVSVGQLTDQHASRVQAISGVHLGLSVRPCTASDCRCRCHLPGSPAAGISSNKLIVAVDQSTNTERVELVDRAINTKARGLMHNGGAAGSGRRSGTGRTTSVEQLTTPASPNQLP